MFGPGERFSYEGYFISGIVFQEFTMLSLDSIREFRLENRASLVPMGLHLPYSPSLEVRIIDTVVHGSTLSIVLRDLPSSSLKTLAFLGCLITEGFMAGSTQFASDRENNTSTSLNRVVIIDQSNWHLPTVASIERLREHVPVIEAMEGIELPKDL